MTWRDYMRNKTEKFISFIFIMVGLVITIGGLFLSLGYLLKNGKTYTKAIISDINVDRSSGTTKHKVYVSYYTEDGQEHTAKLKTYTDRYILGKEVDICYKKGDIENIWTKDECIFGELMLGLGSIFLVSGIAPTLARIMKMMIKYTGTLIYADYVRTEIDTTYFVNGKNPYVVVCKWSNSLDGKTYEFKSDYLWINPKSNICEKGITEIPVYINEKNPNKYFVDISKITKL